jgi:thiol-disulfide isomerase/thioredoxin
VALLAAAAVVFFANAASDDAGAKTVGPVKDLQLASLTAGQPDIKLGDLLDGHKPLVLNLFASWCGPCIREMPDFEKVHKALGDEVTFAGMAVRNKKDDARALVEQTGVTYPSYSDDSGDGVSRFDVTVMPTTVFISASGKVLEVHGRSLDEKLLRDKIREHFGIAS